MKRTMWITGAILAAAAVLVLRGQPTAAVAPQAVVPSVVAQTEQSLLYLDFSATAAGKSSADRIDEASAIKIAKEYDSHLDDPIEVHRAQARRYAESPFQGAWIVIFAGGSDAHVFGPVGAAPRPVIELYSGVIVDPISGEVIRAFSVAR